MSDDDDDDGNGATSNGATGYDDDDDGNGVKGDEVGNAGNKDNYGDGRRRRRRRWRRATAQRDMTLTMMAMGDDGLVFILAGAVCVVWEFAPVQTYACVGLYLFFYGIFDLAGMQTQETEKLVIFWLQQK